MKTLLTARHYQIFLLFFIPAFFIQHSPMREIAFLITTFTLLAWIHAIGSEAQRHIEAYRLKPMNHRLFEINLVLFGLLMLVRTGVSLIAPEWLETYPTASAVVSFAALYCLWHSAAYAARALARAELARDVTFGEWFPNFLQIIFLLLGIWFIQPRINRVLGDHLS